MSGIQSVQTKREGKKFGGNKAGACGREWFVMGCEHSIIGQRLILSAIFRATSQCLYAANGTPISLLGQVDKTFRVKAGRIITTLLVSNAFEKLILGVDWLTAHNCRWDFGGQFIEVDGCLEELQTRPSGRILRRIYAAEEIKIAAGQQVQVPVRATWPGLYAIKCRDLGG